jgi:hypothetical protein
MKQELQTALADKVLRVYFTKRDKSERVMVCTLDERRMPPEQRGKTSTSRPDSLNVWDLEKNGWRTITVDNVTGLESVS